MDATYPNVEVPSHSSGLESVAPSQPPSDLRPLMKQFGGCTYIRTLPAFLAQLYHDYGDGYGSICDSHVSELSSSGPPCSRCPGRRAICRLASVMEGTGNGTDGRKTSFMLSENGASAALSYHPSSGHVLLQMSDGRRMDTIVSQVESVSDGVTAEKIQQSLAAKLRGPEIPGQLLQVLRLASMEPRGCRPAHEFKEKGTKPKLSEFGTMVFTEVIQRLMDAHEYKPRTPRGL